MSCNCNDDRELPESSGKFQTNFLSPKTVNTYRYRIFEKLAINSDVELTLMAVRHGMGGCRKYAQ